MTYPTAVFARALDALNWLYDLFAAPDPDEEPEGIEPHPLHEEWKAYFNRIEDSPYP